MRTVLYNKAFSGAIGTLQFLNQQYGKQIRLIALQDEDSHPFSAFATLDAEPSDKSPETYSRSILELALNHGAELVVPTRRAADLALHEAMFTAAGVDLLSVASVENLLNIDDKSKFYDLTRQAPTLLQPPPYRTVYSLEEAIAAARWVESQGDTPCIKPARGVYGLGFRVLKPELVSELEALAIRSYGRSATPLGANVIPPVVDAWQYGLKVIAPETTEGKDASTFSPWLVMTTCTGTERSIDCLAWHGELLGCVIRQKSPSGRTQVIAPEPALTAQVAEMVRHWQLHAAFNIQTLEHQGQNYLLEINARISGGSLMASLSGLDVGGWAVLLALGLAEPEDVPQPRTGLSVALVDTGLLLPAMSLSSQKEYRAHELLGVPAST